jgi:hypothetical protein
LWETKNTKAWSGQWLEKIKADALSNGAHIAVILTTAMPKGIKAFGQLEGVWVTNYASHLGLALALRIQLTKCAEILVGTVGKQEKAELLFQYIQSPDFSRRVETIVSTTARMKEQLSRERKALNKIWAEREEQVFSITQAVAGIIGHFQGVGCILPELPCLDLLSLSNEATTTRS